MRKVEEVIEENAIRKKQYFRQYNRIIGDKLGETTPRFPVKIGKELFWLPEPMQNIPFVREMMKRNGRIERILKDFSFSCEKEDIIEILNCFHRDRFNYDFEYWAYLCVKIQDKLTKQMIPLELNRGQRKLVASFESMRLDGVPIRVILVKARQWGGSTVTQMYMLWLQLFHYENWHSAIVSQFKNQANNIRNMISRTISHYPREVSNLSFDAVTGSQSTRWIPQRGSIILIGSAEEPDSTRSFDMAMAHLSEAALWAETKTKSGDDLVQSLYATIPEQPGTFICMESTAKGIGTFFHEKWLSAESGRSELRPVFVSWFEIALYTIPVKSYPKLIASMSEYNWWQWEQGATLEGIAWYNNYKSSKGYSDFQMKSEFPTTAEEAFQTKSGRYFPLEYSAKMRRYCEEPIFIGDIRGDSLLNEEALDNIKLLPGDTGGSELLRIWTMPMQEGEPEVADRFVVIVDIGGRSYNSDNSVISVFDRAGLLDKYGAVERAALWYGHTDHDLLAWKAAAIAKFYNNALLVIESNTLETRDRKRNDSIIYEGDHFYTVIDEIAMIYGNMYARGVSPDQTIDNGIERKFGWHMNKKTKYLAYDSYNAAIRDGYYVERSNDAVNEMEWLQTDNSGGINAMAGKRDDIQDTTAVGVYIALVEMPWPQLVDKPKLSERANKAKSSVGYATI